MRLNCHIVNDGYNEKKVWKMHYDTYWVSKCYDSIKTDLLPIRDAPGALRL